MEFTTCSSAEHKIVTAGALFFRTGKVFCYCYGIVGVKCCLVPLSPVRIILSHAAGCYLVLVCHATNVIRIHFFFFCLFCFKHSDIKLFATIYYGCKTEEGTRRGGDGL